MSLATDIKRMRLQIRGAVQGVGFRPFIFRIANEMKLAGWVNNSTLGVTIEVEGEETLLRRFLLRIEPEKPPMASIQGLEFSFLDPLGFNTFEIRPSTQTGSKEAIVLPDIATCAECVGELFNPTNRRYRYPFINCTHCGPRFTIIDALPYDRPNTSMKRFSMCPACRSEYEDPLDRRFHAQPIACPECGPHVDLVDRAGHIIASHYEAVQMGAHFIREGSVVALKGIGGFQLMVNARSSKAVTELRTRKRREEKPFAVMFPSLKQVRECCQIGDLELRLLISPESPIVLLKKTAKSAVTHEVTSCEQNPYLGVMLPYSPLHWLLMKELCIPIVATSGNLSEEPIITDSHEAFERLNDVADFFLVHNRPIIRHADDSIVRVINGRELVIRRARGYAPFPLVLRHTAPPIISLGAQLKSTFSVSLSNNVVTSQHMGDLESECTLKAFQHGIEDFRRLFDFQPTAIACDAHPDYLSSRIAEEMAQAENRPMISVQHHLAHAHSCMAENELIPPVLAVTWDGTGFGLDNTIWGGEFFIIEKKEWKRFASLRPFRIPGGEMAIREPRRSAIGMLYEAFGTAFPKDVVSIRCFLGANLKVLEAMLESGSNSPITTSMGRVFDAVSSLLDLRQTLRYEGQAAMELEFLCETPSAGDRVYPTRYVEDGQLLRIDWRPMIESILEDIRRPLPSFEIAWSFHRTLADWICRIAERAKMQSVVLSGGCFQNRILTELTIQRLESAGFRPYTHQRIPPNDAGISLGQIAFAATVLKGNSSCV